jgi:DNA-damage-inducible protein D
MGKQELAANLFRVTETEAKIRNENVRGQIALENAAMSVGRTVRNAMIENSGTFPERLPISEDIKTVRSSLKKAHKELGKLDKTRVPKKLPPN